MKEPCIKVEKIELSKEDREALSVPRGAFDRLCHMERYVIQYDKTWFVKNRWVVIDTNYDAEIGRCASYDYAEILLKGIQK